MPMVTRKPPPTEKQAAVLKEVELLTLMMREHQDQITKLGQRRRKKLLALHAQKVAYREMAEAMGTTEQAVYKSLRGDL
jgi:DNA-directed RNA polymerase specialized sigma24 family protein